MITLLCLHGWGGSKESWDELKTALEGKDIEILTPDLPGFGEEPDPDHPYTLDDYAEWVEEWLKKRVNVQTNKRVNVIGHSNGGRIAIKLHERGNIRIDHLYLCASAGIKRPRHLKRIFGLTLAKTGKFFLSIPGLKQLQPLAKKSLYKLIRIHDYEKASPIMQQTLINMTGEDLKPYLPMIDIPTDIFWGEEDGMTPIKDAVIMNKAIEGSILHRYPGVRHRVHRDKAVEIAGVIRTRVEK